ncbi:helix-turn-helix domain-containing protein [Microbacterium amylolyticum]|uniref:helix-turn-helix domain-containing protein n=1 Tax=Microbacterium amylolyticum TaxID=936337 RepID=UPI0030B9D996
MTFDERYLAVSGLAQRLGYSSRQLGRVLSSELGAGPIALARAARAHTARILLVETALPITDVAFAAGFSSVRQFNDTVRQVFGITPTALRSRPRHEATEPGRIVLTLPVRARRGGTDGARSTRRRDSRGSRRARRRRSCPDGGGRRPVATRGFDGDARYRSVDSGLRAHARSGRSRCAVVR